MSQLALRAEVTKLARLLGVDDSKIDFLIAEDVATLRKLRAACTTALFSGDAKLFQRLAASTKLMPAALTAVIAKAAMGPMLCARVSGLVDAEKAVAISKHLPVPFLTAVTMELDPRSAGPMLKKMPLDIILAVSREMVARKEFVTMARFVDDLPDTAIRAVTEMLSDADILRVGAFVESHQRLDELIAMLSDARMRGTLRAAAGEPEPLWSWTLAIWEAVSAKTRKRLGDLALQEEAAIANMAQTLRKQDLWDAMLANSRDLSKEAQKAFKSL